MTLQQLHYFKAACRYKNISKAAESLNISQSSISMVIKKLESEFCVDLIKRQRIGFVLTREGELFLAFAQCQLEHVEKLVKQMGDIHQKHWPIQFGIPPMICAILLPTLFSALKTEHPEIRFSFTEAGGHALLQKLEEGILDMALLPADSATVPCGFEGIQITRFEDVCCVAKTHPLAGKSVATLQEIAAYPAVMFSDSFYHNDKIRILFEKANVNIDIAFMTSQLSTMEQQIQQDNQVGFLFRERAEQISEICVIPFAPRIYTNVLLVWKEGRYISQDMKRLIDFFEKAKGKKLGAEACLEERICV